MGREARGTLGHGPQAVRLPVQLEAPLAVPGHPSQLRAAGWAAWEGERLRTPRARRLPESSGWSHLGTCPARAQGKGDGTTARQDPSRGGPGAPAQVRIRPGEGLVRRRGCHPHPGPGPFPWLKVVKVRRCVRVRRNLLVLPSSTRRVNAFVGDSAFWEHRSPSHPLPSWRAKPSPSPSWGMARPGDGVARSGARGAPGTTLGGGRGCHLLQRRGWPGSLRLPRSRRATERLPPSPAAPVPSRPRHRRPSVSPAARREPAWPPDLHAGLLRLPDGRSGGAAPLGPRDRAGGASAGLCRWQRGASAGRDGGGCSPGAEAGEGPDATGPAPARGAGFCGVVEAPAPCVSAWRGWKTRCVPKTKFCFVFLNL